VEMYVSRYICIEEKYVENDKRQSNSSLVGTAASR
jgi:hypothetical protein